MKRLTCFIVYVLLVASCCSVMSAEGTDTNAPASNETIFTTVEFRDQALNEQNRLVKHLKSLGRDVICRVDGSHVYVYDQTKNQSYSIHAKNEVVSSEGLKVLQTLSKILPGNTALLSAISERLRYDNEWERALEYLKRAGTQHNTFSFDSERTDKARFYEKYGCILGSMGRYSEAKAQLDKAIELAPEDHYIYLLRADYYKNMGSPELALRDRETYKRLSSRARKERTDAKAYYERVRNLRDAREQVLQGRYSEALSNYRKMVSVERQFPFLSQERRFAQRLAREAVLPYGDLSVLKGTFDVEVEELFPRKLKKRTAAEIKASKGKRISFPVHPSAPGMPPKKITEEDLEALRSLFNTDSDVIYIIGHVRSSVQAKKRKGDVRVYRAVADALFAKQRLREALAEYNKILRIAPDDLEAVRKTIEVYGLLHDWKQLERACNTMLKLYSEVNTKNHRLGDIEVDDVQFVLSNRARAKRALNDFSGAIQDYSALVELKKEWAQNYQDRADCYMSMSKYQLAIDDYTRAINCDRSKAPGSYKLIAAAYERLGKHDLAVKDMQAAEALSK